MSVTNFAFSASDKGTLCSCSEAAMLLPRLPVKTSSLAFFALSKASQRRTRKPANSARQCPSNHTRRHAHIEALLGTALRDLNDLIY